MRKQILAITTCWLLSGVPLLAGESPFAYVRKEGGFAARNAVVDHKFQVAKSVLDRLIAAKGDLRLQAPELVFNNAERYVAWMDPEKAQIGLEEKAYDISVTFGADSLQVLAALLAHELTHYYEKHDFLRHFSSQNADQARDLNLKDEGIHHEIEADYLGGFLAYSAGFQTLGLMPVFLDRVYQAYGLPEAVAGYPPLSDRRQFALNALEQVKKLVQVYDMATMLTVLERYGPAEMYLNFILKEFQSRELYNNLGVIACHQALELFSRQEFPWVLPLEYDSRTRLAPQRRDPGRYQMERCRAFLEKAIVYFDRAAALDPEYPFALVNKSAALLLLGIAKTVAPLNDSEDLSQLSEFDDATITLKKARKRAKSPVWDKLLADCLAIEGVLAMRSDTAEAIAIWGKAAASGSQAARQNLAIQARQPILAPLKTGKPIAVNRIEDYDLEKYLQNPQVDEQIQINDTIIQVRYAKDHSTILLYYANEGRDFVVLHLTSLDYAGSLSQGITLGADISTIQEVLGMPDRIVETPYGDLLRFANRKLILQLDAEGKLEAWAVYRVKE